MKSLGVLLLLVTGTAAYAFSNRGELHTLDGPFNLKIVQVRSISPQTKVGFGKSMNLYAVDADGPKMHYVLYCTYAAPEAGKTYTASEVFVSGNLSPLRLWPTDRKTVPIPDLPKKGEKTLFRQIDIEKVFTGAQPDEGCDIHTETPIAP